MAACLFTARLTPCCGAEVISNRSPTPHNRKTGQFADRSFFVSEETKTWLKSFYRNPSRPLTGLLRGLSGSPVRAVASGATLILADERLEPIAFGQEDLNRDLIWRIGDGDPATFTFLDRASLPLRVGHLMATTVDQTYLISWTQRGREHVNNWEVAEAAPTTSFLVETFLNDASVSQVTVSDARVEVPIDAADLVRVAALSIDGRMGEWGSIPLPPA